MEADEGAGVVDPLSPGFRLELFNVYETAARMLLEEHPPFDDQADSQRRSTR